MKVDEKTSVYHKNIQKQRKRDLEVLKYLAAGPATGAQLHKDLFSVVRDGKSVMISRSAFDERMSDLIDMGLIKKQKYRRYSQFGSTIMFAIDETGIEEISLRFGIEPQYIRNDFPSIDMFKHEIMLSSFVRIARREEELKKYKIGFLYDDVKMKSAMPVAQLKKMQGTIFYPDLRMEVLPHYKDKLLLNIELDTGRKKEDYWKRKLKVWRDTTLVLTLTEERLNVLINIVHGMGLTRPTGFAVANTFSKYGLTGTKWRWLPANRVDTLDIGKVDLH